MWETQKAPIISETFPSEMFLQVLKQSPDWFRRYHATSDIGMKFESERSVLSMKNVNHTRILMKAMANEHRHQLLSMY